MDMIERYIAEVGSYLPAKGKEDIQQELKNALMEKMDDLQEEYERELTREEVKNMLRKMGHPLKVAGSFHSQQYLIGPAFYPVYWHTMKICLSVVFVVHLVLLLISGFDWVNEDFWVGNLFGELLSNLLWAAVIVTVIFVLIEQSGEKIQWLENWDPEKLKSVVNVTRTTRSEQITNVVTEGIGLLWWNDVWKFSDWNDWQNNPVSIHLSDAWDPLFWPVNILLGAAFIFHSFMLISGSWTKQRIVFELVLNVSFIAVFIRILTFDDLAVFSATSEKLARIGISGVESIIQSIVGVMLLISLYEVYKFGKHFLLVQEGQKSEH